MNEIPMFGFEPKERAKSIKLKLLEQSIRVEDNLGKAYKTRPIQAWALLSSIATLLKEANVNYKAHPIYVRADSSGVAINDRDRSENKYNKSLCPINKWIFDQLVTKIDIPHMGNDLVNGTIAVSYVSRGINVALGLNVKICDNLAILGGQQLRTYKFEGHNPLDWENMKTNIRHWIQNIDQKLQIEMNIMERMMERQVDSDTAVEMMIGKLYAKAVEWRYFNGNQAPFDISGMSTFTKNVISKTRNLKPRKSDHNFIDEAIADINNVWDLYNLGTNVMKPDYERIETLAESGRIFADFLCEEFGIEREDLVQDAVIVD